MKSMIQTSKLRYVPKHWPNDVWETIFRLEKQQDNQSKTKM